MSLSKSKQDFCKYLKQLDDIHLIKEYDTLELMVCFSVQHRELLGIFPDEFGEFQDLVVDEIISRFAEKCNDESVYRYHEHMQSLLFNWDGKNYPPDSDSSALCAAEEPASL